MDDKEKNKLEEKERQKAARNTVLTQILNQEAMGRLNGIALVKPEKGQMIESILLTMAQRGEIPQKLDEQSLVDLIQRIQAGAAKEERKKITIIRKRQNYDSDEDY